MHRTVPLLLLLISRPAGAQLVQQSSGTDTEFRALSAPSAQVVWAGGRGGVYARTTDGGRSWRADSIPGASGLFLTGVWAQDARTAYLLGTSFDGGLARIYRTDDAGMTWTAQWESREPDVFMDALQCWSVTHCVAYGDPVGGALVIMRTTNGRTWSRVPADRLPALIEGEAGFAASGTTLTLAGTSRGWIGTGGGARARVYITRDGGSSWSVSDTPLPGNSTSGIFGIAFRDSLTGVAVGGNYEQRTAAHDNVLRTRDGGRTWTVTGAAQPAGVRYGAAYGAGGVLLAAGPSGVGVSHDDSATWTILAATPYNSVVFAPNGDAWVAGPAGRIAKLTAASLTRQEGRATGHRQTSDDSS